MNLFVGNLAFETTESELKEVFQPFGQVVSINIIKDKFSGESRGFGFVEMSSKTEAQSAITGLNDKEFKGRTLTINEARPRTERQGRWEGKGGGQRNSGGGRRY